MSSFIRLSLLQMKLKQSACCLPSSFITNVKGLHKTAPAMEVKGQVAQKFPTKIRCEEGKTYAWCACGLSNKQPLCDGSHKRSALGLTPLRWTSSETKEYFFCNCKQTNSRPFCDGSHKKL